MLIWYCFRLSYELVQCRTVAPSLCDGLVVGLGCRVLGPRSPSYAAVWCAPTRYCLPEFFFVLCARFGISRWRAGVLPFPSFYFPTALNKNYNRHAMFNAPAKLDKQHK